MMQSDCLERDRQLGAAEFDLSMMADDQVLEVETQLGRKWLATGL
jgi:hypothetical protein